YRVLSTGCLIQGRQPKKHDRQRSALFSLFAAGASFPNSYKCQLQHFLWNKEDSRAVYHHEMIACDAAYKMKCGSFSGADGCSSAHISPPICLSLSHRHTTIEKCRLMDGILSLSPLHL
ncbi:mCG147867, isoform CRA_b, partial [Mus musculus]